MFMFFGRNFCPNTLHYRLQLRAAPRRACIKVQQPDGDGRDGVAAGGNTPAASITVRLSEAGHRSQPPADSNHHMNIKAKAALVLYGRRYPVITYYNYFFFLY